MEGELLGAEEQRLDYMAPFLIRSGHSGRVTAEQALRLRDDCLADWKQRLVNRANIIQARFEKVLPALLPGACLTGGSSALAGG